MDTCIFAKQRLFRRSGRAVECTGLENRHTSDRIGGSNPSSSATKERATVRWRFHLEDCVVLANKHVDKWKRARSARSIALQVPPFRIAELVPTTASVGNPSSSATGRKRATVRWRFHLEDCVVLAHKHVVNHRERKRCCNSRVSGIATFFQDRYARISGLGLARCDCRIG